MLKKKENSSGQQVKLSVDAALMFPSCTLQDLEHEASPLTFTHMKEPALTLLMAVVH